MKKLMSLFVLVLALLVSLVRPASAESSPMEQSREWLVKAMKAWVPVADQRVNQETLEEAELRYSTIAHDALAVAFDPEEKQLFDGPFGRQRTALLMVAIAKWESNYVKRIDEGDCRPDECDHGRAACLMQVHAEGGLVLEKDTYSYAKDKSKAWLAENEHRVITKSGLRDRRTCFRAALHKMRESLMQCRTVPTSEDRLGIYTGEGCNKERANQKSRTRIKTANWYTSKGNPPVPDTDILERFLVN